MSVPAKPAAQARRIRQDTEETGPHDPWEPETRAALSAIYAEDRARIGRMDGVELV